MKTYAARPADVQQKWILIDADGLTLGRLAALIAVRLRGKDKSYYTPHVDCGDRVVVVNADGIRFSGDKLNSKRYYWHTGYVGGIKSRTASQILASKSPCSVLEMAVRRMLPSGPLGRKQMSNLRLYAGDTHPHEAQKPEFLDVKSFNRKNVRL